jgi:CBS-domain-containing membrane protein
MSGWKRTVPALLILLIASMPLVYFQLGNLVYTQAAATNMECSGHSARNTPDEFSVSLWNEDIDNAMYNKSETLAGICLIFGLMPGKTKPLRWTTKTSHWQHG